MNKSAKFKVTALFIKNVRTKDNKVCFKRPVGGIHDFCMYKYTYKLFLIHIHFIYVYTFLVYILFKKFK